MILRVVQFVRYLIFNGCSNWTDFLRGSCLPSIWRLFELGCHGLVSKLSTFKLIIFSKNFCVGIILGYSSFKIFISTCHLGLVLLILLILNCLRSLDICWEFFSHKIANTGVVVTVIWWFIKHRATPWRLQRRQEIVFKRNSLRAHHCWCSSFYWDKVAITTFLIFLANFLF